MEKLSLNYVNEIFTYNKELGKLYWNIKKQKVKIGSEVGTIIYRKSNSYLYVRVENKLYAVHRIIWFIENGKWPSDQIDHIDGDGLNNKIENLRDVRQSANMRNRKMSSNNKTGGTGVTIRKSKLKGLRYRSEIVDNNGKNIHLGTFDTLEEAILAREDKFYEYGYTEWHGF